MRRLRYTAAALALSLFAGCGVERATEADCVEILERIVELEIRELGYVDPALSERYRQSMRARYTSRVEQCVGRPIPANALQCIHQVDTAEAVSHDCLR